MIYNCINSNDVDDFFEIEADSYDQGVMAALSHLGFLVELAEDNEAPEAPNKYRVFSIKNGANFSDSFYIEAYTSNEASELALSEIEWMIH